MTCKNKFINPNFIRYCSNHNWMDESIKDQSIDELNGLLKLLNINETVSGFHKTEYTTLLGGEVRCDLVCTTEKNYRLNIEAAFIGPEYHDIARQCNYASTIYIDDWRQDSGNPKWKDRKNYLHVKSIYITSQPIKEKEITVDVEAESFVFTSKIYSFKNIDYPKYMKQITEKINNGKKINYEEIAFLKFIILTTKEETSKVLMKAIKLLNKDKTIDIDIKTKIKMIYIRNCILYVNEEDQIPILEELTMESLMLDNFAEMIRKDVTEELTEKLMIKGREQGLKEGMKEGLKEGEKRGREEGLKEGMENGMIKGREQGLKEGMENGMIKGREEERNKIKKILESKNIPKETMKEIIREFTKIQNL